MTRTAAVAPTTLPTDRPPSLLPWQEHDDGFAAADYRIRLLGPYQWEISHRGRVLDINSSRRAAFEAVEDHYRRRLRFRDTAKWAIVAATAAVVGAVAASWPGLHALWLVAVVSAAIFVWVSAFMRLVATITGNRNDPYRRRDPWERGRRRRRSRSWHAARNQPQSRR